MTIRELNKAISGVFVKPKKVYYLGRLIYGTPYFFPINFDKNIISLRKLKSRTPEEIQDRDNRWPHLKGKPDQIFSNLPMVRRSKYWIFKLLNSYYWLQIGWPIVIGQTQLGWKDKFNSPRFEWCPAFYIFFFHWQFIITWKAPDNDNDRYYEMILSYLYYNDKDLKKTGDNWGWKRRLDDGTYQSTWNEEYILSKLRF